MGQLPLLLKFYRVDHQILLEFLPESQQNEGQLLG